MKTRKLFTFLLGTVALLIFSMASGRAQASSTYALSVSSNSNRTNAVALQGAPLSGSVYVFTSHSSNVLNYNPTGISKVCYWLDNPSMTGAATHCESVVPYDFAGTASGGGALPWATGNVANGTHTITQSVTLSSGGNETDTATFSVGSSAVAPSVTTQPASQSVSAGQAASFSVAATGTAPLGYQWKKNGTAISGATASNYTTPATTSSDNGAQFAVAISNAAGSMTSSAATLKVSSSGGGLPGAGSIVTLQNANSKLCVDTGSSTGFTNLIQSACSNSKSQQFTLVAAPTSSWFYLSNTASNLCWDIAGGSLSAGALIMQYTCTAVSPEYYQLKAVSGGYQILAANLTNGCVDVIGASTASGANLEQSTCNGATNQLFAVSVLSSGSSTAPQVTLVPASVSFSNVALNTSNTQTIKLANSGTASLTVSQDTVPSGGFSVSGLTLPLTLSPGQSSNFNVAFAPTTAGSVSGNLSLASNASNSPATLALSGAGVTSAPPSVSITSPTNGATVSGTISVSGTASDAVGVSSVQLQVDGGAFSSASGTTNWSFSLDTNSLSNAAHSLTARATDTSGLSASSAVSVNVSNSSGSIVNVSSYGATGNGSTDDTAAINNAISALSSGATLFFPCGTYKTSSQLTLNISNVTVDGGSCATIHNTSSGTVFAIGGSGNGTPNYGSPVALSATANELATSFTTISSLGVAAGDYVRLQQGGKDSSAGSGDTGCDAIGCRGELLKVASVSGNTITVTTALHDTYNPSVNGATAQKILSPLTGITVKNITFDGNGSNVYGLAIAGVVNSTISGVTSTNVQGSALLNRGDFNVSWSNITVTRAGSAQCGSSAWFENQANIAINGLSISNENQGTPMTGCLYNGAFGFELIGSSNNTIANVTVDHAGASGRPCKLGASRYNTLNSLTCKNGVAAFNGVAIHYYSSHNTFNNCVITNNGAGTGTGTGNAGINSFGNFNQYNTFNNCTVSGNGNIQVLVNSFDALRLAQDSYITINGGTFTGENSTEPVIIIEGANAYIHNAIINGAGATGLSLDSNGTNACINNNTFTTNTGLGGSISSASSTNIGSGNILNGLSSNLTLGVCTAPLP